MGALVEKLWKLMSSFNAKASKMQDQSTTDC